MNNIGIFSKLGMPGGSENRVTQLANSFCRRMPTYIFAEKEFSKKLKPQLDKRVILRENTVTTKKHYYELQAIDRLLVVNSDSYSFCKPSYWDGTQGKHHNSNIDISQIPLVVYLFNYVVGPAQWLVDLKKVNPSIKILCTSKWFVKNIETEDKFKKLRKINLPIEVINSPVGQHYAQPKKKSRVIRINRHSMSFAYKHDYENVQIVDRLCKKYGDSISFKWMGVPSHVRDIKSSNKEDKVPYKKALTKHKQFKALETYSTSVPDLLKETDILFFYISRFRKEPWPRTIAEGMMGGCCCVTNNNYGMAEQIENGKTGFLFNDADEAVGQLSHLIENPKKIQEVGENAQQHALNEFLDDTIIDKTLNFMRL